MSALDIAGVAATFAFLAAVAGFTFWVLTRSLRKAPTQSPDGTEQ